MNTETTNSSIFDKVASAPAITEQTPQTGSLFDKVVNSDKYEAEHRQREAEGVFDFVRQNYQDEDADAVINLTDFFSKTYNISRQNALDNMDIYVKDYFGKATPKKSAWQQIKDGYTEGRITDKTGRLYNRLMWAKDEDERKRLQFEIDKLEAQMPNKEGNATTGAVTYLESANNLFGTMVRPLVTSAAVSALFPQSLMLTVFSGLGKAAPVIASIGAKALQTGVVFNETRKVETGLIYKDMMDNGVQPDIARKNAVAHGIIAGALETASIEVLLARFPFMKKAAQSAFMRLAARERMTQGAIKALGKIAADNALSIPISVISETVTEELQERSAIYFERKADLDSFDDKELGKLLIQKQGEWERYFDDEIRKQKQDYYVSDEYIQECKDRIWEVRKQTAKGMLVIGLLGAGANTVTDLATNAKQTGRYKTASEKYKALQDSVDKATEAETKAKEAWQENPTPENEKAYTEAKEARDTAERAASLTEEQKEFNELVNTTFDRELTTDEIDRIQELDNILQVRKDSRPQQGYEDWLKTPEGIEHEAPQTLDVGEKRFREIVKQYTPGVTEAETDELINLINARARFAGVSLDNYMSAIFQDEMAQFHDFGETIDDNGNPVQVTRKAKGAVTFAQDGKAIIHLTPQADFSTWVHEVGHIFRRQLSGQLLTDAEAYYGVKDGRWTVEAEERFTEDFTTYLMTRRAPSSSLEKVFRIIADALHNIYDRFSQRGEVSEDIARVFDRMLADPDSAYGQSAGVDPYTGETDSLLYQTMPTPEEKAEADRQYKEIEAQYKDTEGWMKAPNGKPTKLTERQWVQVRTPNFKAWFGDWENDPQNASKVVDENGEPRVVYHGTDANFDVFDKNLLETQSNWSTARLGFFFETKENNIGQRKIPCFINIKNPLTQEYKYIADFDYDWKNFDNNNNEHQREKLNSLKGHDGLIVKGEVDYKDGDGGTTYVVAFSPEQIKSATDNVGTFDSNNPSILHQIIGEVGAENLDIKEESTTRLDNLVTAKKMEKAGNDALTIRLATGWERGFDNLWRYEIPDGEFNEDGFIFSGSNKVPELRKLEKIKNERYLTESERKRYKELLETLTPQELEDVTPQLLMDYYKSEELYKAYPFLRSIEVRFDDIDIYGAYQKIYDRIVINNELPVEQKKSTLIHEIQHAIQHREGFAEGTNPRFWKEQLENGYDGRTAVQKEATDRELKELEEMYYKWQIEENNKKFFYDVAQLENNVPTVPRGKIDWNSLKNIEEDPQEWKDFDEWRNRLEEEYGADKVWRLMGLLSRMKVLSNNKSRGRSAFELYEATSGEVEARNVQARMNLTQEERRKRLLSETEDVERKNQLYIRYGTVRELLNSNISNPESTLLLQENEQTYQQATEQGQYVPDEILRQYAGHDWADTEIAAREDYRRDAREYGTFEQFLAFEQGFDFTNRSAEYYEEVYNSAQGAPAQQVAEGIQTRDESNRKFLEEMTRERMETIFNIIAKTDEFHEGKVGAPHKLVENTLRGMMKGDKAISQGNYNKIMALMKDDPDSFREFIALAFNDQEEYELIKRQKELFPANEVEQLRATNRQLRSDAAKAKQSLKEVERKIGDLQDTIHWINTRFQKYKDKTSKELETLKEDKEALRAAAQLVKYETWHKAEEKAYAEKIKAGMRLDATKERLQGKIDKQKAYCQAKMAELRQAQKERAYYQRLMKIIFRKPPQMCDVITAHKILAIQAQFSPTAMLEKTRARLEMEMMNTSDRKKKSAIQLRLNKQSLREMTFEQIAEVAETVAELRKEGVERRMNQLLEIREKRLDRIAGLKNDLGDTKSLDKTGSVEASKDKGKILDLMRSFWWDINRISEYMGRNWEAFFKDEVGEAYQDELRNIDRRRKALTDKMRALKLDAKTLSKTEEIQGDKFEVSPDGNTYTHDILLHWYICSQNPDSWEALIFGNFKGNPDDKAKMERIYNTIDEGMERLSPEEKALADWMIESFSGDDRQRLWDTFIKVENRSPEMVLRYFPMIRAAKNASDVQNEPLVDLGERSARGRASVTKNFSYERIHEINWQYQKPLHLGAMSTYIKAIQNQEHYIAFAQLSKDMKYIYQSLSEEVTAKYGEKFYNNINGWIDRVINPNTYKARYSQQNMFMQALNNSMAGALAGNVVTMIKQAPSMLFFLPYCTPGALAHSLYSFVQNREAMTQFAKEKSPYLANRNIDDILTRLNEQLADPNSKMRLAKEVTAALLKPIAWIDEFACVVGWNAVYSNEMSNGATEEAAVKKANEALLKTQPQATAIYSPQAYNTGDTLLRTMLVFTRQANQIFQMITADMPHLNQERAYRQIVSMGFVLALNALLMGWIGRKFAGYGDDDDSPAEDVARDIISNIVTAVPVFGQTIVPLINRHAYTSSGYVNPISGMITETGHALHKTMERNELDMDTAMRLITDAMGTAGLPKVLTWRAYKALKESDAWYLFIGSPLGGKNGSK